MFVHPRVTPSIEFASTQSYTWVERGNLRVNFLAQEQNTAQCPWPRVRTRTWTVRSGVERTNHDAPMQCSYAIENTATSTVKATYAQHNCHVKITCNTVEYTKAFLYSDWLYFLWHGINSKT